jgi:hypothetical protein
MLYRVEKAIGAEWWTLFYLGIEGDDCWHHVPGCPWYRTEQEAAGALLDFRKSEVIRVKPW